MLQSQSDPVQVLKISQKKLALRACKMKCRNCKFGIRFNVSGFRHCSAVNRANFFGHLSLEQFSWFIEQNEFWAKVFGQLSMGKFRLRNGLVTLSYQEGQLQGIPKKNSHYKGMYD